MTDNSHPAFPSPEIRMPDGQGIAPAEYGMTLRDYFAAQAIPEAISVTPASLLNRIKCLIGLDFNGRWLKPEAVAIQCYRIADAMLAERSKP